MTAYSAHADQQMLVDWLHAMPKPLKEIRLMHGEDVARSALDVALA
ncbi:MBL fold metallo-hydrolase RNA specificity domain-containing protein [Desulfocastanea catecholica]